jgi:hypothetical protein
MTSRAAGHLLVQVALKALLEVPDSLPFHSRRTPIGLDCLHVSLTSQFEIANDFVDDFNWLIALLPDIVRLI